MSEASDLITVSYDITGKPHYNGYLTVHEALWNLEDEFKNLDFADRMLFSIEILNDLEADEWPARFFYTFNEYGNTVYISVYEEGDFTNPVIEYTWEELYEKSAMTTLYDIEGLHRFLVYEGELLPIDELTLFH